MPSALNGNTYDFDTDPARLLRPINDENLLGQSGRTKNRLEELAIEYIWQLMIQPRKLLLGVEGIGSITVDSLQDLVDLHSGGTVSKLGLHISGSIRRELRRRCYPGLPSKSRRWASRSRLSELLDPIELIWKGDQKTLMALKNMGFTRRWHILEATPGELAIAPDLKDFEVSGFEGFHLGIRFEERLVQHLSDSLLERAKDTVLNLFGTETSLSDLHADHAHEARCGDSLLFLTHTSLGRFTTCLDDMMLSLYLKWRLERDKQRKELTDIAEQDREQTAHGLNP